MAEFLETDEEGHIAQSAKTLTRLTLMPLRNALNVLAGLLALAVWGAGLSSAQQKELPRPQVKVVENGESKARPEECRGIIVGPGVNQPDPFPGYAGFVGWESPIRLANGDWLVGFNAGYWHASAPTPLRYPRKTLDEFLKMGMPDGVSAPVPMKRPPPSSR